MPSQRERSETRLIRCAACGALNRVPWAQVEQGRGPVCGRCKAPLPVHTTPVTVTDATFPAEVDWPRISVVVCTYNGARTLRETLEGCLELDYPDYELIVVDDGSTDGSGALAEEYGATVIRTSNRGLSAARNTGLDAATGAIVAYLDDDARPDPTVTTLCEPMSVDASKRRIPRCSNSTWTSMRRSASNS